MKIIGFYKPEWKEITGITPPRSEIYQSDGLIKHIEKRHPDMIEHFESIRFVINDPDYIGANPREPDSFELVKVVEKNLLVAIKLDTRNDYLYVASLYAITDSKLERRVKTGRLIPVDNK